MSTNVPDPGSASRNEPKEMDSGQLHNHHAPGSHPVSQRNSSAAHPPQHLQKQTRLSPPVFQREAGHIPQAPWEELLALLSPVAGTKRRCCPSREPGRHGTDRIAGDSSGELDLAPLPSSSQTLLAWHKLLPHTCLTGMEINCKAKEVPGGSRSGQGWLEGIGKSRC